MRGKGLHNVISFRAVALSHLMRNPLIHFSCWGDPSRNIIAVTDFNVTIWYVEYLICDPKSHDPQVVPKSLLRVLHCKWPLHLTWGAQYSWFQGLQRVSQAEGMSGSAGPAPYLLQHSGEQTLHLTRTSQQRWSCWHRHGSGRAGSAPC